MSQPRPAAASSNKSKKALARFLRRHWGKLPVANTAALIGVRPGQTGGNDNEQGPTKRARTERIDLNDLPDELLDHLTKWLSLADIKSLVRANKALLTVIEHHRQQIIGARFRLHVTDATFNRAREHSWISAIVKISTDSWTVLQRFSELSPRLNNVRFQPTAGNRFVLSEARPLNGTWQLEVLKLYFTDAHFDDTHYWLDLRGIFPSITSLSIYANQNDNNDGWMSAPQGNHQIHAENFPNLRRLTVWNASLAFGNIPDLPTGLEKAKLWIQEFMIGSVANFSPTLRRLVLRNSNTIWWNDENEDDDEVETFDTLASLTGLRELTLTGADYPQDWYTKLPPALSVLVLGEEMHIGGFAEPQLIVEPNVASLLSRTLRELYIDTPTWVAPLTDLPPHLTTLVMGSHRFANALDTLPATLRHLSINGSQVRDGEHVVDCALIPNIETIECLDKYVGDMAGIRIINVHLARNMKRIDANNKTKIIW